MVTIDLPPYKSPYTRGTVILDPKAKLQNGKIKPKFFLLMEDYTPGKKDCIALMTTSRKEKYSPKLMMQIKIGGLGGINYSVVLFNVLRHMSAKDLTACKVVTHVWPVEMRKLEESLKGYLRKYAKYDEGVKERLLPGYKGKVPRVLQGDQKPKHKKGSKRPVTFGKDWLKELRNYKKW